MLECNFGAMLDMCFAQDFILSSVGLTMKEYHNGTRSHLCLSSVGHFSILIYKYMLNAL